MACSLQHLAAKWPSHKSRKHNNNRSWWSTLFLIAWMLTRSSPQQPFFIKLVEKCCILCDLWLWACGGLWLVTCVFDLWLAACRLCVVACVFGFWLVARGLWSVVRGLCFCLVAFGGLWRVFLACGLYFLACGLWFLACGVWLVELLPSIWQ